MERWTLLNGINNSSNMPLKANVRKSKKVIVSSKKRQIIEIEGELDKDQIDIVNNSWHIYHKDISTYAALSKAS